MSGRVLTSHDEHACSAVDSCRIGQDFDCTVEGNLDRVAVLPRLGIAVGIDWAGL